VCTGRGGQAMFRPARESGGPGAPPRHLRARVGGVHPQRTMRRTQLGLYVLFAIGASAPATAAPTPPHRSTYKPALILQWKDRLHVANVELQRSNWKRGYDNSDSVLREMRDSIASGDASGDLLAVALLFRALGESGLGKGDDASWDFGTAQTSRRTSYTASPPSTPSRRRNRARCNRPSLSKRSLLRRAGRRCPRSSEERIPCSPWRLSMRSDSGGSSRLASATSR
jgi:hypothetical protein